MSRRRGTEDALDLIAQEKWDLLILDLMMPRYMITF
ncbi:MAG: hypothetical protein A4E54_00238 [Pelotomaculum sp. PtaB.Bin117]|nr:MAG: hypothetical protein A4E54_00238 [Pelotomaculum sp. PtaB.Bin117]OPY63774.1 MAG: hypothetical protein A4E56_00309 [Pelotomaculum sp. PtaU1.Bin065]